MRNVRATTKSASIPLLAAISTLPVIAAFALLGATQARAVTCSVNADACDPYVVTLTQVGPDVVATSNAGGEFNTDGLTQNGQTGFTSTAVIAPRGSVFNFGSIFLMTGFAPISGPSTFEFSGIGGATSPTTVGTYIMGPVVGINGGAQPPSLYLPAGYNNNPGTPLDESEAIFANRIIACVTTNPCGTGAAQPGLGVQPGSYTWTWGSATSGLTPSNRDQTFTICTAGDCPTPTTPEIPAPAALPLFATGLGALGLFGWRRKRRAQAVA